VLVNTSVNETLSRTTITSLATFFTTVAIAFFTRGSVRDFGLALSFGIIVGSYSTIFVAAPIYLWVAERFSREAVHRAYDVVYRGALSRRSTMAVKPH